MYYLTESVISFNNMSANSKKRGFFRMDDDILTIEEVARYLRVSERTVYDWAQKGEIPSAKLERSGDSRKAI